MTKNKKVVPSFESFTEKPDAYLKEFETKKNFINEEDESDQGPVEKMEQHIPTFQEYTEEAQPLESDDEGIQDDASEDDVLGAQAQDEAQDDDENAQETMEESDELGLEEGQPSDDDGTMTLTEE
jgi:hypothetical protein